MGRFRLPCYFGIVSLNWPQAVWTRWSPDSVCGKSPTELKGTFCTLFPLSCVEGRRLEKKIWWPSLDLIFGEWSSRKVEAWKRRHVLRTNFSSAVIPGNDWSHREGQRCLQGRTCSPASGMGGPARGGHGVTWGSSLSAEIEARPSAFPLNFTRSWKQIRSPRHNASSEVLVMSVLQNRPFPLVK